MSRPQPCLTSNIYNPHDPVITPLFIINNVVLTHSNSTVIVQSYDPLFKLQELSALSSSRVARIKYDAITNTMPVLGPRYIVVTRSCECTRLPSVELNHEYKT